MKRIFMIGPSPKSKGGIASVISEYHLKGLISKWSIVFCPTHVEGGKFEKLSCVTTSLVRFLSMLVTDQIALLHLHVARRNSFWRKAIFMQLAFWARCPVLIHLHSGGFPAFYEDECGYLKKALVRYFLERASALIVLTESWKDAYAQFRPRKLVVVPNFVALQPLNKEPDRPTLVFLGRLTQEKGFFDLLNAIALLQNRYPDLLVRICGEGDFIIIKELLRQLNILNLVRLEGWVDGDLKRQMLCNASVFVLPSYVEGLPMGVLEAMSCGLPVIATRVGGIPDIIEHEVNGILVESGHPKELADQIARLLSDTAFRKRLAVAGRQTIKQRYSVEAVLPSLENLYRQAGLTPDPS
ncbi:MAG TPA: hypothetical protein DCZ48_13975 [Methylococcaceae bacterium]|nr:hypothetical protein [Methylococcaceae bacterium]